MAAGGPRTWPGFTASQPPKTQQKEEAKKKEDGGKTHKEVMLREEHDWGCHHRLTFNEHPNPMN